MELMQLKKGTSLLFMFYTSDLTGMHVCHRFIGPGENRERLHGSNRFLLFFLYLLAVYAVSYCLQDVHFDSV